MSTIAEVRHSQSRNLTTHILQCGNQRMCGTLLLLGSARALNYRRRQKFFSKSPFRPIHVRMGHAEASDPVFQIRFAPTRAYRGGVRRHTAKRVRASETKISSATGRGICLRSRHFFGEMVGVQRGTVAVKMIPNRRGHRDPCFGRSPSVRLRRLAWPNARLKMPWNGNIAPLDSHMRPNGCCGLCPSREKYG